MATSTRAAAEQRAHLPGREQGADDAALVFLLDLLGGLPKEQVRRDRRAENRHDRRDHAPVQGEAGTTVDVSAAVQSGWATNAPMT